MFNQFNKIMKKLFIIMMVVIAITMMGLQIAIINKLSNVEVYDGANVDSIINKVQIDSIELAIKRKDSTIINIHNNTIYEINKANALNDSSSVELFKQLLSN